MAYNQHQERTYTAQCGADLSQNQFQFVKIGTGELLLPCAVNETALGILTDVPSLNAQGQYCGTIAVDGITRLAVAAAYPIGTFIVPGTDGFGYSVADAGSSEQYIRAYTLQASLNAYDVVPVKLIDPHPDVYSRGATGLMGPSGSTGILGLQGVTGLYIQGVTGFYGQTGIMGLTGLYIQGNTGIMGLTGLALGATGIQGETGIAGMTGIQGNTGIDGNTGIQGNTGISP